MRSKLLVILLIFIVLLSNTGVFADDGLNGVTVEEPKETTTTTETVEVQPALAAPTSEVDKQPEKQANPVATPKLPQASAEDKKDKEDSAKAVGELFKQAGPKQEDIEEANAFLAPFAKFLNKVMAVILGLTGLLMMLITILDLLYMAFPPARDMLDGGMNGQQVTGKGRGSRGMGGMRGMRGMGMGGLGGMEMGMPGIGGMDPTIGMGMGIHSHGMQQPPQQHGGGLSALGRWISDEAIAACMEANGGPMGAMQGISPAPIKSMLFSYMKKRSVFLILFGVCVVLFSSTVFTDLGIRIGMWILETILGFGV